MPGRYQGAGMSGTKNVFDTSNVIAPTTNTTVAIPVDTLDDAALADPNGVRKNCKIFSMYLSVFAISEGGEVATEVPLIDWYFMKDPGKIMQTAGFVAGGMPTPGATGTHQNKRFILHEEKGLSGGGEASIAGVPMVFKGVIKIPKGMQTFRFNDRILINIRTNFQSKFCLKAIYKWYI